MENRQLDTGEIKYLEEEEELPLSAFAVIEDSIYLRCEKAAEQLHLRTDRLIEMLILNGLLELEEKDTEEMRRCI